MYQIVRLRKISFGLSLLILLPGVVALAVWGLQLGIDFTGGTIIEYTGAVPATVQEFSTFLEEQGKSGRVQPTGESGLTVRLPHLPTDEFQTFSSALKERFPALSQVSFETVGPSIGQELRSRSITATILVLAGIMFYVTWAFRRVSGGPVRAWTYGAATIIALFHDVFIVIGVWAVLGRTHGFEVDSLFVTAILTILGFSVHDTIVVFDRIRERVLNSSRPQFADTVNESVNQTLVRSLNTSLTTLLVLLALYLFGGESIRGFTLALLIGIGVGTYSSIFVAAPLLVVWEQRRRR